MQTQHNFNCSPWPPSPLPPPLPCSQFKSQMTQPHRSITAVATAEPHYSHICNYKAGHPHPQTAWWRSIARQQHQSVNDPMGPMMVYSVVKQRGKVGPIPSTRCIIYSANTCAGSSGDQMQEHLELIFPEHTQPVASGPLHLHAAALQVIWFPRTHFPPGRGSPMLPDSVSRC